MKTLTAGLKTIINKTLDEMERAQAAVKQWQAKKNIYEKSYFNTQLDELKGKVAAVTEQGNSAIDKAVEEYKSDIKNRNQLKGEDLTPDAKLLNNGFVLEKSDLQAIFDRSQGNYTMQVLTMRYAEQHKINIDRLFISTEQTIKAADTVGRYAKNALTRPEYRELWNDSKQWEKIESPALV